MANQIKITTDEGKDYTLAFNNKTVKLMSANGFRIEDVWEKPIIGIPALFHGSFSVHHKGITQKLTDEIWATIKGKEALIEQLVKMYQKPIEAVLDEPEEDEKNATWEVV